MNDVFEADYESREFDFDGTALVISDFVGGTGDEIAFSDSAVDLTVEQVTEISDAIQAAGLVEIRQDEGDCGEGRVSILAIWDNEASFIGAMPEPVFTDPDSCIGDWTMTSLK